DPGWNYFRARAHAHKKGAPEDEAMNNEAWGSAPVLRVVGGAAANVDELEAAHARARAVGERLRAGLAAVILGQDEVLGAVVLALLAGGHVLLEGAPG